MSTDNNITLMNTARINRSLRRMAHEIIEQNTSNLSLVLLGINERGFIVASALQNILEDILLKNIATMRLPLNDDIEDAVEEASGRIKDKPSPFLIVVDDVIFSGQTMFNALKEITGHLSLSSVHTAALIDRGHRKFPIVAEFCGLSLPTKLNEHVSLLTQDGKLDSVVLTS